MEDGIGTGLPHQIGRPGGVADIAGANLGFSQASQPLQVRSGTLAGHVIEKDHRVPPLEQPRGQVCAEETTTPGDQELFHAAFFWNLFSIR